MNKILVIASGGLDSTVLYYYVKKKYKPNKIKVIHFIYNSKHNKKETKRLKENIPAEIINIKLNLEFSNSALINKSKEIPKGNYKSKTMKDTVIPFRNGIMLSYAVSLADELNYNIVALGNHSGDHYIYPDCRPEFIRSFNASAQNGTDNKIKVISPFLTLSKTDIVQIGKELKIENIMFNSWTCYNNYKYQCGECGSCNERIEAFNKSGIIDKTKYLTNLK